MRTLVLCCAVFSGLALAADAPVPSRPPIMLLMQFEQQHSPSAIEEMKRELEAVLETAGITFQYKLRSELGEWDTPADIIVVKFKGRCRTQLLPALFDERGPFAITRVTDGEVLPFSEVACDQVRVSIQPVIAGSSRKQADMLLGRALGRVLAHEIYHIVGKTDHHTAKGVTKSALSPAELVGDKLKLDSRSAGKLRR